MRRLLRRKVLALVIASSVSLMAAPALADKYDPESAGHPLRIVAYVLHPVGVALDWLIFRPAHWIGSKPPLNTIFGHEDETPTITRVRDPEVQSDPALHGEPSDPPAHP
jgi:hypothetical protein